MDAHSREGKKEKIWRSFKIGNLINLMMLDTRSVARDKQLDIESYFEVKISKQNHIKRFTKTRKLLGNEQFRWIKNNNSNEFKWSIFGQQILIGPKYLPNILSQIDIDEFPSYIQSSELFLEKKFLTTQINGMVIPKKEINFIKLLAIHKQT